jgi:hypothetical protein
VRGEGKAACQGVSSVDISGFCVWRAKSEDIRNYKGRDVCNYVRLKL